MSNPGRILLTGASGLLGRYLLRELRAQDIPTVAWTGSRSDRLFGFDPRPVPLDDADAIAAEFHEAGPTVVLHAGATASVAACFRDPETARKVNVLGTQILAELTEQAGARMVLVSTDLVFDGERGWYREDDPPAPLSVYGQTKAAAERVVLGTPDGSVARVSLLYGPHLSGGAGFFDQQVRALRERTPQTLFEDEWRTPLDLPTAARGLLAVAESGFTGLLHLGGPERLSRLDMGRRLATHLGADSSLIVAASRLGLDAVEPRPRDTSLDSSRLRSLFPRLEFRPWDEALRKMFGPA